MIPGLAAVAAKALALAASAARSAGLPDTTESARP